MTCPRSQRSSATLRLLGTFFLVISSLVAVTVVAVTPDVRAANLTVTANASARWSASNMFLNEVPVTVSGTTVTDAVSVRVSLTAGVFTIQNTQFTVGPCPTGLTATLGATAAECYVSGAMVSLTLPGSATIPAGTAFTLVYEVGSVNAGGDVGFSRTVTVGTYNGNHFSSTLVDSGTATLTWPETVTFNANGGTGSMQPQTAAGATPLTAATFTKAGLVFDGWSFWSGGPQEYADGASYPFTQSRTLYARWAATVTFDANGGTGVMQAQTAAGSTALITNAFTRAGHTFMGWNTDHTAAWASYMPGAFYDFSTSITLYAVWQAAAQPVVNLSATSIPATAGTPITPLTITTQGMTGPVTFTVVTRTGQATYVPATLPAGLTITPTGATTAEITGTPTNAGQSTFYVAASDNGAPDVYSQADVVVNIAPATTTTTTTVPAPSGGDIVLPAPTPAATSTTTGPTTTVPVPVGIGESDLITELRREQLTAPAGAAKMLVGGELVDVTLTQASTDLRSVAPADRTAEHVTQLQSLATSMLSQLRSVLGGNTSMAISVRNTPTGAVIVGLARNPDTGESIDIPVEDVTLVTGGGLVLMATGVNGERAAKIGLDGALEIPEGGYVSVIAGGLTPGADGEVAVMSTPRLIGDFAVGDSGEVAEQAGLPRDLELGHHTVVVTVGDEAASLGFRLVPAATVTPEASSGTTSVIAADGTDNSLPTTGSNRAVLPWALLFMALGTAALVASTRRRHA